MIIDTKLLYGIEEYRHDKMKKNMFDRLSELLGQQLKAAQAQATAKVMKKRIEKLSDTNSLGREQFGVGEIDLNLSEILFCKYIDGRSKLVVFAICK